MNARDVFDYAGKDVLSTTDYLSTIGEMESVAKEILPNVGICTFEYACLLLEDRTVALILMIVAMATSSSRYTAV